MQQRMLIREVPSQIGKEVFLKGWVSVRRDHGKLVFLDVRDRSGSVQVVVLPNHLDSCAAVHEVRNETVVSLVGRVNERPANAKKEGELTGGVEIEALELTILAKGEEDLYRCLILRSRCQSRHPTQQSYRLAPASENTGDIQALFLVACRIRSGLPKRRVRRNQNAENSFFCHRGRSELFQDQVFRP